MQMYADQIRRFVPGKYYVLGTDGYGRSDTRAKLRKFFEVDRYHVTTTALKALADQESIPLKTVADAISKFEIDPAKPNPAKV